MTLSWII